MNFKSRPFIFLLMGMSLLMGTVLLLQVLSASCVYNSTSRTDEGYLYLKGKGVKKDKAEARKWLEKAAAQGDVYAAELLNEIK